MFKKFFSYNKVKYLVVYTLGAASLVVWLGVILTILFFVVDFFIDDKSYNKKNQEKLISRNREIKKLDTIENRRLIANFKEIGRAHV